MIRKIITIDRDKCTGCGLCATACHEGAIGIVDGKAVLLHEHYCDGLGDCLPACPENAISFEEREAAPYDQEAVKAAQKKAAAPADVPSQLSNFPVQLKLVPVNAPWYENADLLIAADCCAYAYGNFHSAFMKNKVTLIGCPKLDSANYAEKLAQILAYNDINSVTVTRMTVPCCGGLAHAVKNAIEMSGKDIPLRIVTVTPDGNLIP